VAAQRLTFERLAAPYGDPAADDRLAADVAADASSEPGPLSAYLRARTAFFDRVVVAALAAGIGQAVVAAAGYDGRALRYAKPGVRWFELDHPDTQRDKRERLTRLGLDVSHIAFVAADFGADPVADALAAAGLDPDRRTLITVEGVAVYLPLDVLERLLRELRSVVPAGSRLAISLSVDTGSPDQAARRARFNESVARLGEPARSTLTAADADELFARTGWRAVPRPEGDRARAAGLVVAEPV
jgi:methyltransferase (TIGR00027 family)